MMIKKQEFGRTGHLSTRTLFGGASLGKVSQDDADRSLEVLLKYEVNHIDTAASYGDSELRIGPWMARYRDDFFLASKTGERTYDKAKAQIHSSLERLRVEVIDLIQLHNLVDPDDWEVAMGDDGALKAAIEAREQGLVRFIGVTGHGMTIAAMHKRSLERFDFDSVLLPYNYIVMQDPQYAADFEALIAMCQERNVAVQTIKSIARRPWAEGEERTNRTWYKPFEDQADIDRAVHWVLSKQGVFLNAAGDINLLPKVLDAASRFQSGPSEEEMKEKVGELEMETIFG